jgi:membrane fusion protein, heavy metal efflux system
MKFRHVFIITILILISSGCKNDNNIDVLGINSALEVGQHNGKLLRKDNISVEIVIDEDGSSPRFRAWIYRNNKLVNPDQADLIIKTKRLGKSYKPHILAPQSDNSFLGISTVEEPHSFDIIVQVKISNELVEWTYSNYEGRTEIDAGTALRSGIKAELVREGEIIDEHEVQGLLTPIDGDSAVVMARFPGPVKSLNVNVGDNVGRGQIIATVESNISLTTYAISSPISGVVMSRNVSVGQIAGENESLYEIANLNNIWVDLHVFGADAQLISPGSPVEITRISDGIQAKVVLERILPGTATASQSAIARATISNTDGLWRPGSAVKARITVTRNPAKMIVPISAIQESKGQNVVYVKVGNEYESRIVTIGKKDSRNAEILSGLSLGDFVVTEQSYLVKADIEKSNASHDH